MSNPFHRPIVSEGAVVPYRLRQVDAQGQVLSETEVAAHSYSAALRELDDVVETAQRIEVLNDRAEKAGEVNVDYWRLKWRRGNKRARSRNP